MATSIYRLAEEIQLVLAGGVVSTAFSPSINELKISVAQVANTIFKVDYFQTNLGLDEPIPNGAALGTYEGIAVVSSGVTSYAVLPCKPIKLPRNMGIWSIYPTNHPELEFIPVQMGQSNLLRSQSLLNNLMGHLFYENVSLRLNFPVDLTLIPLDAGYVTSLEARLVIMDFSAYDDYEPIPVPAEQEWEIKKQVLALYGNQITPDKLVDPGVNEQTNIPVNKQRQA